NNIHANGQYGLIVLNPAGQEVDATLNWWGDATGPASDTELDNPHGADAAGDAVSDNVDFMPWYAMATTTPATQNVSVDHLGSIIAYSDTIQGGIDVVVSGDTINVAAGTYNEELTINKSLTLLGAQADVPIVNGVRAGEESIIRGKGTSPTTYLPSSVRVV
ncbi:unnamed protein product, partial [marine sediment metagenome]